MTVSLFTDGIEPDDPDAPIWRFMEFWKLQDLLKGQLYFRRSDKFEDESEGLPLDNYEQLPGHHPDDLNGIQTRNNALGFDAQIRQGFYISCWSLAGDETLRMWHTYASGNGVAVCSTYRRLKSVLEPLESDRPHLGLVRYGSKHLVNGRRNLMVNISTKRQEYEHEKEVRAMLWILDPHESGNRHIDINDRFHDRPVYDTPNPEGLFRRVSVGSLITEVIISPFASAATTADVERSMEAAGFSCPIRLSEMSNSPLLPTADDLRRYM